MNRRQVTAFILFLAGCQQPSAAQVAPVDTSIPTSGSSPADPLGDARFTAPIGSLHFAEDFSDPVVTISEDGILTYSEEVWSRETVLQKILVGMVDANTDEGIRQWYAKHYKNERTPDWLLMSWYRRRDGSFLAGSGVHIAADGTLTTPKTLTDERSLGMWAEIAARWAAIPAYVRGREGKQP